MRNLIIIFSILFFSQTKAENNLNFYTLKALDNNLQLNAERKNLEAAKQPVQKEQKWCFENTDVSRATRQP